MPFCLYLPPTPIAGLMYMGGIRVMHPSMLLLSFQALHPCIGASDQILRCCPNFEMRLPGEFLLGTILDDFFMNCTDQDGVEIALEIPGLLSLHTGDCVFFFFMPLVPLTRTPSPSWLLDP